MERKLIYIFYFQTQALDKLELNKQKNLCRLYLAQRIKHFSFISSYCCVSSLFIREFHSYETISYVHFLTCHRHNLGGNVDQNPDNRFH